VEINRYDRRPGMGHAAMAAQLRRRMDQLIIRNLKDN
jgi:hypothetical protein